MSELAVPKQFEFDIVPRLPVAASNLRGDDKRFSASDRPSIIGQSRPFVQALALAKRVAPSRTNILITGESGTGKEVLAQYIHDESGRRDRPFVAINCSAIPENLLESELFGHSKGSFTGATDKRVGLFEAAQDGTLFLDEIGDLNLSLQAKLLRVIQERHIKRVGENQQRPIHCRIIAATHFDLAAQVAAEKFREDLYFRLNVIPISIPPLRERPEDILPLAYEFIRRSCLENERTTKTLSRLATQFVCENQWRGNVRELRNMIERAVVLSEESEILPEHFLPRSTNLDSRNNVVSQNDRPSAAVTPNHVFTYPYASQLPSLNDIIQGYIEFAIKINMGARDKTARDIGIDRKTLYRRMRDNVESLGC